MCILLFISYEFDFPTIELICFNKACNSEIEPVITWMENEVMNHVIVWRENHRAVCFICCKVCCKALTVLKWLIKHALTVSVALTASFSTLSPYTSNHQRSIREIDGNVNYEKLKFCMHSVRVSISKKIRLWMQVI